MLAPLPFVAVYEVLENEVQVLRILHGAQQWPPPYLTEPIFLGKGGIMKRVIAAAFSLLIIFSATILMFAKGTTTKVMITSAELQSPIEISDPEVLKNFNVWSGPDSSSIGLLAE